MKKEKGKMKKVREKRENSRRANNSIHSAKNGGFSAHGDLMAVFERFCQVPKYRFWSFWGRCWSGLITPPCVIVPLLYNAVHAKAPPDP
jgi:hypothetical protein